MPIFEYRPMEASDCPHCADGFETLHKQGESILDACPSCGRPVRRIISAPNLAKPSPSLKPKNVEKHGFTQYRKAGSDTYEKTAGVGPRTISRD